MAQQNQQKVVWNWMIDHSLVTGFTMLIRRSFDMACFGISKCHRHEPPLVPAQTPRTPPSDLGNRVSGDSRARGSSAPRHKLCARRSSKWRLGIPSRAKRSIGWTQLWGGGTHSPRLSARRHTSRAHWAHRLIVCAATEPRWPMSFGRELARAVVPPSSDAPRSLDPLPRPQRGCRRACGAR